jgi:hypothetical protein
MSAEAQYVLLEEQCYRGGSPTKRMCPAATHPFWSVKSITIDACCALPLGCLTEVIIGAGAFVEAGELYPAVHRHGLPAMHRPGQ